MKTLFLSMLGAVVLLTDVNAQTQYKIITTIESIVPMGLGRSRIIEGHGELNVEDFTTERTTGKDSKQGDVKRGDAKIEKLSESKILNFYSGVGINFQNVASNDALMSSKLNNLSKEGWELVFVAAGVESKGSKDDKQGIFITRYIFKGLKGSSLTLFSKPIFGKRTTAALTHVGQDKWKNDEMENGVMIECCY